MGKSVNGGSLTVTNGLVLNGTMAVGDPSSYANGQVNFLGSQDAQPPERGDLLREQVVRPGREVIVNDLPLHPD